MNEYCVLILSHGRSDRVYTVSASERYGYTGDYYIVIDDEDAQEAAYRERYGDKVVQFCKQEWADKTDDGDNLKDHRVVVYARNAAYDIAKKLGYRYFIVLDDDYNRFQWRFNAKGFYTTDVIRNLDKVFDALLQYYKSIPAQTLAIGQGGDYLGGSSNKLYSHAYKLARKAMNLWFMDTERPINFIGRINEDVNVYTVWQRAGMLFLSYMGISLNQHEAATNPGGLADIYIASGWYKKAMYSVMYCPSGVYVRDMGTSGRRIHHRVRWNNVAPKIVHERWRKA